MSSSDIFDVLNIQQKSKSPSLPANSNASKVNVSNRSQVTGMQRELYNLLGDNQPPIMVESKNNRFKEKLNISVKPSPWTLAPFKATPTLTFNHWVKGSKELVGSEAHESSFAKYNKHLTLPTFTKEEYNLFMAIKEGDSDKDKKTVDAGSSSEVINSTEVKSGNTEHVKKEAGDATDKADDIKNDVTSSNDKAIVEENESGVLDNDSTKNAQNSFKVDDSQQKVEENNNNNENPVPEVQNIETINENIKSATEETSTQKEVPEKSSDVAEDASALEKNKNSNDLNAQNESNNNESGWKYEEVEYLFNLCRNYDLNWPVIHDRYNYDNGMEEKVDRKLEDLKAKFYEVSKKYFLSTRPEDPLLAQMTYPKEKELERKKYLDRLLARSAAEIAEEEALIIESRKFEMAAKKTLSERESLLTLLDSPNSNQSVSQFMTSQGISQLYSSLLSDKARKRKHVSAVPENPWMKQQKQFAQQRQRFQQIHGVRQDNTIPAGVKSGINVVNASGASPLVSDITLIESNSTSQKNITKKQKQELQTAIKRKAESAFADNILQNFNSEEQDSLGLKAHGEKLKPGVYTRSSKISTYKPAVQNKINTIIQELGLPIRPAMLTSKVFDKYEELTKSIITLTDLKKHLDKLEAENAITK